MGVEMRPERKHQLLREVNRRIKTVGASFDGAGIELLCECGQPACDAKLEVGIQACDGLLDRSEHILMALEHRRALAARPVVAELDGFVVVAVD